MPGWLINILTIAVILISLGAGTASILLSNDLNKVYNLNYLESLFYNKVLIVIFGVYGLLGTLFIRIILNDINVSQQIIETLLLLLPFLGIPFLVTAWYLFIKVASELTGYNINRGFTIGYFVFQVLFFLGSAFLLLRYNNFEDKKWEINTDILKFSLLFLFLVSLIVSYYYIYIKGSGLKSMIQRKEVLYFGHINLLVQILAVALFLFSDKSSIISAIFLIVFFGEGIPSILFLKSYLLKNAVSIPSQGHVQNKVLTYLTSHDISRRETEIVEKICDGMTNQQIADVLFISLQTVKDHTHNIYKKLGVSNRVQMVNLIRNLTVSDKTS